MARTLIGTVTSDKADKTIVITVHTRKNHPIYKKQYSVTTKFMAHDEKNEAKMGDKVEIVETRPLSARKRFTLNKVLETAKILHTEADPVVEKKAEAEGDK
jgi:small subunit ribosomal protein S17